MDWSDGETLPRAGIVPRSRGRRAARLAEYRHLRPEFSSSLPESLQRSVVIPDPIGGNPRHAGETLSDARQPPPHQESKAETKRRRLAVNTS